MRRATARPAAPPPPARASAATRALAARCSTGWTRTATATSPAASSPAARRSARTGCRSTATATAASPAPNSPASKAATSPLRSGPRGLLLEQHSPAAPVDVNRVLGREAPFQDRLGERILHLGLDGALERPRAVNRVEAHLRQLGDCRVGDLEAVVHPGKACLQHVELDARDGLDVLLAERVEHHHLVDAIDELGAELRLHLAHHGELHHLVVTARHALDHLRAE